MNRLVTNTLTTVLVAGLTGTASAQSDPARFDFVYNIGAVPTGSMFDITGADIPGTLTTGTQVGDGNPIFGENVITPAFLGGDTLGLNSQLNLFDGGEILFSFDAGPSNQLGSNIEVNIVGGTVGDSFNAFSGSTVNISGGSVGDFFDAFSGSLINVTGGIIGDLFSAASGSRITISGGSVGTDFGAFSGSTVNIAGGSVGEFFEANSGSTINISGGSVGELFEANSGSTVNISDGFVGDFFEANSGSTVNISGGSVGSLFGARNGSMVNISGGPVGNFFEADFGSTVNLSGGSLGEPFNALDGSTASLLGTSFLLDGLEVTGLEFGEAFTIDARDVLLTGFLVDGSTFDFDLSGFGSDFFDAGATLTVTLVPTPGAVGVLAMSGLLTARRRRCSPVGHSYGEFDRNIHPHRLGSQSREHARTIKARHERPRSDNAPLVRHSDNPICPDRSPRMHRLIAPTMLASALLASVPVLANAQCPALRFSSSSSGLTIGTGFSARDLQSIAISGDRLYAAGFQISPDTAAFVTIDVSNPAAPIAVAVGPELDANGPLPFDTLFNVDSPAVALGTTYFFRTGGNLVAYDMSVPAMPELIGTLDLPGFITQLETDGVLIYAVSSGTLHAVDFSNPLALRSVAQFGDVIEIGEPVSGRLPVLTGAELLLLDVSAPTQLTENFPILGSAMASGDSPRIAGAAVVVNNRVTRQYDVYDITDPTAIAQLQSFPDPLTQRPNDSGTYATDRADAAGSFYFATSTQEDFSEETPLAAVDFSNPAEPRLVSLISAFGGDGFSSIRFLIDDGIMVTNSRFQATSIFAISACAVLPAVTMGPFSQITSEGGEPITLNTVTEAGVFFQWLKDDLPITDGGMFSGTTTDTLTIQPAAGATGAYRLRVTNTDGEASSVAAVVGVRPGPPSPDFNMDGTIDFFDVVSFLAAFDADLP